MWFYFVVCFIIVIIIISYHIIKYFYTVLHSEGILNDIGNRDWQHSFYSEVGGMPLLKKKKKKNVYLSTELK